MDGVLYRDGESKSHRSEWSNRRADMEFEPAIERPVRGGNRQRGLAYWASGDDRRIYTGVGAIFMQLTRAQVSWFAVSGQNGSVNLQRLSEVEGSTAPVNASMNSPGVMHKDLYIVSVTGAPGTVQAYDVRTGEVKWVFYMVPRPGEYGYSTWPPNAYKTSYDKALWAGTALRTRTKTSLCAKPESRPRTRILGSGPARRGPC